MARWIKGQSGNPKGRPREGTAVAGLARSQVEKRRLLWPGCQRAHLRSDLGRSRSGVGCVVLSSEYKAEAELAVHAAAIRARVTWISGLLDPQANGRNQVDGNRLIQMFRSVGLVLQPVDNPLESGVLNVRERMQSGRLKVFASLTEYLTELRLYRCDEKDQIIREHDNLQDATRGLINGIAKLRSKPVTHMPRWEFRGEHSWILL